MACYHASPRCPHDVALLDQIGLQYIFDRVPLLAQRRSQVVDSYRPAIELVDHGQQQTTVEVVEATLVDIEQVQCLVGDHPGNVALPPDLGEVAYPAQQAIGDSRRTAGALGDFRRALRLDLQAENAGRPTDDGRQVLDVVELQALDDTEAIASGLVSMPARVVAPTSVNGGRVQRMGRPRALRRS